MANKLQTSNVVFTYTFILAHVSSNQDALQDGLGHVKAARLLRYPRLMDPEET